MSVLLAYRQFRNLQEIDVAKELAISIQDYKNMEAGAEKVDVETSLKLSALYSAPPHFFLSKNYSNDFSIIYSHCHFQNSNGYVNHLYYDSETVLKVKDEIIQLLKEEVGQLRKENDRLMAFLGT